MNTNTPAPLDEDRARVARELGLVTEAEVSARFRVTRQAGGTAVIWDETGAPVWRGAAWDADAVCRDRDRVGGRPTALPTIDVLEAAGYPYDAHEDEVTWAALGAWLVANR